MRRVQTLSRYSFRPERLFEYQNMCEHRSVHLRIRRQMAVCHAEHVIHILCFGNCNKHTLSPCSQTDTEGPETITIPSGATY
jgi:hypothetical protein